MHIKSRMAVLAAIFLVIISVLGGLIYFKYSAQWINTNNARVEGRIYAITSEVSGVIRAVNFDEFDPVSQGDLLIRVDSTLQELAVEKVEAALEKNMLTTDVLRELLLEEAHFLHRQTEILSPSDGYVANLMVRTGERIAPGQPLKHIVNTDNLWVVANFTEGRIRHIREGQDVDIYIDAFPGESFRGRVASIMPATGGTFALFPSDPTAGNWVRVAQRIPVRISFAEPIDPSIKPRIGMLARVRVRR